MKPPRLIQTFLIDGTLEGVRIIECESSVKAFVIPRIKINDVKTRPELAQPALYFLVGADGKRGYIGESENFFHRIKNHDQEKQWWDVAIAVVSLSNSLEKSDVKYLESMAVELAHGGSMQIENKTIPSRNTIHEFKQHGLAKVLEDAQFVLTFLGYDLFSSPQREEEYWYCKTKHTDARAVFRGDQFIVLAGSALELTSTPSFEKGWPADVELRNRLIVDKCIVRDGAAYLSENVAFRSPNDAGQIVTGRSINAWTIWKDATGRTMDEVMRKVN